MTGTAHLMARPPCRYRADDYGLRRALSSRLLPLLAGAMVFLAAQALAAFVGAASLAARWQTGAAAMATVTVPSPGHGPDAAARTQALGRVLATSPAVSGFRELSESDIAALLKPWLGRDPGTLSLRLPAMFELRLKPGASDPHFAARVQDAAPGAVIERAGEWLQRITALIRSLEACAALALLVAGLVAAAVVAVATGAALAVLQGAIEIVHALGASDSAIAGQLAGRAARLVLGGGLLGVVLALPVLLSIARLAAPFQNGANLARSTSGLFGALPPLLWASLAALPLGAAAIGWVTAQVTVRVWLRKLP